MGTGASAHTVTKTIVLNAFPDLPNVIQYTVQWHTPTAQAAVLMAAPATFLTPEFTLFRSFDPHTGANAVVGRQSRDSAVPTILSTPDGAYALSIYAVPAGFGGRALSYQTLSVPGKTGTNVIVPYFSDRNLPAGDYTYQSYVIVGTVGEVAAQMSALARK